MLIIFFYLYYTFFNMTEETIHERLDKIMKSLNLNYRSFGMQLGVSDVVIGNIIKGRNKPSYDIIEKLKQTFDWINIDWLFTGNGTMRTEDILYLKKPEDGNISQLLSEKNARIDDLHSQIEKKDNQIKDLLEIIKQK